MRLEHFDSFDQLPCYIPAQLKCNKVYYITSKECDIYLIKILEKKERSLNCSDMEWIMLNKFIIDEFTKACNLNFCIFKGKKLLFQPCIIQLM